jgi:membrane glycosyltransferase
MALTGRIAALRRDLPRLGFWQSFDIFVLSDSDDPRSIAAEAEMARAFAQSAMPGPAVYYRRRRRNTARKPGNIAEWVRRWGGAYGYMLVLDADSRMSGRRIGALVHRMETNPHLGLIQAGVRLTGGESRFARLQQLATRLYGPAFAAGIAGWSGSEGNYWGHNALIRVRAFAAAAGLPKLGGRPPFGGDGLSHDFVEAAWLRRAGWAVEIEPDSRGSAEGGPETVSELHKRDRRWCQGNLQHLRVLFARGLHPVSRLHLLCGIGGYLAAPLWLGLVLAATLLGGAGAVLLPSVAAVALILTQKLMGVLLWMASGLEKFRKIASSVISQTLVSSGSGTMRFA